MSAAQLRLLQTPIDHGRGAKGVLGAKHLGYLLLRRMGAACGAAAPGGGGEPPVDAQQELHEVTPLSSPRKGPKGRDCRLQRHPCVYRDGPLYTAPGKKAENLCMGGRAKTWPLAAPAADAGDRDFTPPRRTRRGGLAPVAGCLPGELPASTGGDIVKHEEPPPTTVPSGSPRALRPGVSGVVAWSKLPEELLGRALSRHTDDVERHIAKLTTDVERKARLSFTKLQRPT